jgi:hypothetical protein
MPYLMARDEGGATSGRAVIEAADRDTGAAPKKSAAIPLARLRLKRGQRMAYVFDFGDEWRVDIRLNRIVAAGEGPHPRVVEASGDAPPQYPDWDDADAA